MSVKLFLECNLHDQVYTHGVVAASAAHLAAY